MMEAIADQRHSRDNRLLSPITTLCSVGELRYTQCPTPDSRKAPKEPHLAIASLVGVATKKKASVLLDQAHDNCATKPVPNRCHRCVRLLDCFAVNKPSCPVNNFSCPERHGACFPVS